MADVTLYDSTTQNAAGAGDPLQSAYEAFSFSTGAAGGSLSDVKVGFFDLNSDSGTVTAYLYSDNLNPSNGQHTPGVQLAQLGTLSDSAIGGGPTLEDFGGAAGVALAPNTRYWVELVGNNSTAEVETASGYSGTGVSTEYQTSTFNTAGTSESNGTDGDAIQALVTEATCFTSGTRLQTSEGEVEVEMLAVGDLVATMSGVHRSVIWIGRRTIDCRNHPRPHDVMPIRISAHAFGENLPERDLFLSPGHPVLVGADEDGNGGHLVPIMCLINGTTIECVEVDEVTYWHVELDEHNIFLAEGLPVESYIDLGSRTWFEGADGALYDPDITIPDMPGRCRPVAVDGAVVEAERRRLDTVFATRLQSACAWPSADEALAFE